MPDTTPASHQELLQREKTRRALLDSAELFHCVFDAVGHGILVLDAATGELLLANPALCRMLDYPHDGLLALQLEQLQAAAATPALRNFLLAPQLPAHPARLPLRRSDGSTLNAEVASSAVDLQGRSLRIGLFRDISDTERAEQAEEQARHDGLTTLYNHRTFQELLGLELARAQRHGTPVSLLMIDIDRFKQINDTLGHQAGDAVLRQLASLLLDSARNIDQVCRYGGEEFVLILPMTTTQEALHVAERMRKLVEVHEFACGPGHYRRLTVSIGVASYPLHAQTQPALIAAADAAMYAAKQAGRNRCCVCDTGQAWGSSE